MRESSRNEVPEMHHFTEFLSPDVHGDSRVDSRDLRIIGTVGQLVIKYDMGYQIDHRSVGDITFFRQLDESQLTALSGEWRLPSRAA